MADHSDPTVAGQAVLDPTTSASDLAAIAHQHPSLQVLVVAHPNVYPGLLDWLEAFGDPAVAAAARRTRDKTRPRATPEAGSAPAASMPPSPPAPSEQPPEPPAQGVGPAMVVVGQPVYPQPARTPVLPVVAGVVALVCIAGLVAWVLLSGGSGTASGEVGTTPAVAPAGTYRTVEQGTRPAQAVTPAQREWEPYSNGRFGFALDVPTALVAQPESDNGDGRMWTSPDGQVHLAVYGSNNTSGATAKQMLEQDVAERTAAGEDVTYQRSTDTFYVVSGYQSDGQVFYLACWVGTGSLNAMWWLYPTSQAETVEPWLTDSYHSFVHGNLAVAH